MTAEKLSELAGVVYTPKGFKEAYRTFREGGWTGLSADPACRVLLLEAGGEGGHHGGAPYLLQMLHHGGRRVGGVVPPLERGDGDRGSEHG